MPQRDRAPPEDWVERKDRETRRAFERFEEKLRAEFHAELEDHRREAERRHQGMEDRLVSWKGFAVFIVPLVAAVLGLVSALMSPVKDSAAALNQRADKLETTVDRRLSEQDKKIERVGTDVNAVMRVTVDGKSPRQARREWESATGVPRIDAAP